MLPDTPAPSGADAPDLERMFADYVAASIDLDAARVAAHYDEPFALASANGTPVAATRADAETLLRPDFDALRAAGYDRTEFPTLGLQPIAAALALVSGLGVRYAEDGTRLAAFGITYTRRRTEGGWKLAVMTVHDPDRPLALR